MGNKKIKQEAREKIGSAVQNVIAELNSKAGEKLKKTVENAAKQIAIKYLKVVKEIEKREKKAEKKIAKKEKKATKARLKAEKRAQASTTTQHDKTSGSATVAANSKPNTSAVKSRVKRIISPPPADLEKTGASEPQA